MLACFGGAKFLCELILLHLFRRKNHLISGETNRQSRPIDQVEEEEKTLRRPIRRVVTRIPITRVPVTMTTSTTNHSKIRPTRTKIDRGMIVAAVTNLDRHIIVMRKRSDGRTMTMTQRRSWSKSQSRSQWTTIMRLIMKS